jgi:hypothetical protein
MLLTDDGWLIADSARLWEVAVELGVVEPGRGPAQGYQHPFAEPLGTRRVLEQIGLERVEQYGVLSGAEPGEALLEGMSRLWELDGLDVRDLAGALAEGGPFAHLLRFSLTGRDGEGGAGYSIALVG